MKPILSHTNSLLLCGCHQKAQCHLHHLGRPELRDDPRQSPKGYVDRYPLDRIKIPENFLPKYPQREEIGAGKGLRDEKLAPFPRDEHAVKVNRQEYYAIITHMDAQLGRVLDTLDREGLTKNTIVVFAGDNGLAVGQHGLLGKQNLYDHSIRVPLILAGPGIPAGQHTDTMVYLFDIFPTLCELLNLPIPSTVDGKSFLPVLKDPKRKMRDGMVYAYRHYQRAIRTARWKMIRYNANGVQNQQLFDLAADPWEMKNLAEEPELKETRNQLDILMRMLLKQNGDSLDLSKPDWGWRPNG